MDEKEKNEFCNSIRDNLWEIIKSKKYPDPHAFIKKISKEYKDKYPGEKLSENFIKIIAEREYASMMEKAYLAYEALTGKKNPLCLWKIYFECRRGNFPVPEEILNYFDNVAKNICCLADNPPETKKKPIEIAKALGLHSDKPGRNSPFDDYQKYQKELAIFVDAEIEIEEHGGVEDYPFEIVAKNYEISSSKVRRIHKKYSEFFINRGNL